VKTYTIAFWSADEVYDLYDSNIGWVNSEFESHHQRVLIPRKDFFFSSFNLEAEALESLCLIHKTVFQVIALRTILRSTFLGDFFSCFWTHLKLKLWQNLGNRGVRLSTKFQRTQKLEKMFKADLKISYFKSHERWFIYFSKLPHRERESLVEPVVTWLCTKFQLSLIFKNIYWRVFSHRVEKEK
jgi:hypothetical protein